MSDIGTITAAASKAKAAAAAAAEERRQRSISWAFRRVSTYPQAQAEASYAVTAGLAAFDAAVVSDYGSAPGAYLAIVRAMAAANAVAAEYAAARGILREAGLIGPENPGHRPDPVGYLHAPHPATSLPAFADLVASSLEVARGAAFRLPSPAEDPGSFSGPAPTEAERLEVCAYEWTFSQEAEHLLGYRAQYPELYARNVSDAQKTEVAAYAAGRLSRDYNEPLPKVVVESSGTPYSLTARQEAQRRGRMG